MPCGGEGPAHASTAGTGYGQLPQAPQTTETPHSHMPVATAGALGFHLRVEQTQHMTRRQSDQVGGIPVEVKAFNSRPARPPR
jgi:hypothetical protein